MEFFTTLLEVLL